MLNYRLTALPSPIHIILILSLICASESQIPPSSNQQALEVQIQNSPSSYEGPCQIALSAISNNFTKQNPEGFETFMISILNSKYDVKFQNFHSPPYIYTEKELFKSSDGTCKRGEFNSSFYCLSISSSNKSSARLKYNDTHFMYKFILTNIKCPNKSEIAETGYHAQFKIEVPINSSSKDIKLTSIINYRFGNINDQLKVNVVIWSVSIFIIIIGIVVIQKCRKILTDLEKWVYFWLILTEAVIKVVLILGLKYFLAENLREFPKNNYLAWFFIVLLVIKNIILNLGIAISFGMNIKKQQPLISKKSIALFVLAMLVDYKLYFLFIFSFCPFCQFNTRIYLCKKNVQRYIKLLDLEACFILLQIILISMLCSSLFIKIIFTLWLIIFAAMIALVMKTMNLEINKDIGGQLDEDKQSQKKQQPIKKMDQGELARDEKQQQISDLEKEKEKMKQQEPATNRPLSLALQPYNEDKNDGGY